LDPIEARQRLYLLRRYPVINKKLILNVCVCLYLLLSLPTSLSTAQESQILDDPGVILDEAAGMPPEPTAGESTQAISMAFSGGPVYDSGWVRLDQDESKTLTHNLGGEIDGYVVDMQYWSSSVDGINQRYYGGCDFGANPPAGHAADDRVGAYWRSLTTTSIIVYRRPQDTYAEKVRIRIWYDTVPDYDSGWVAMPLNSFINLNHNLGGNSDDYIVDMQFRSSSNGVNQRNYGGIDLGAFPSPGHNANDRVGAYWQSLTNASISMLRRSEDDYAVDVRIRIWVRPTPTYDSGWILINPDQARTLTHSIGGNAADYIVDMQFNSASNGANQRHYGGADFGPIPPPGYATDDRVGAYWRTLTSSSITIYRRPEDNFAQEIRIRIWNAWKPSPPDYDSGWVAVGLDQTQTLTHTLGGSSNDYYVDMLYRASSVDATNQRYYGGMDFGAQPTSGHLTDDRVGAYWRSLNTTTITVYRRPEDTYAEEVRMRIWVMPQPDFDSGWTALAKNTAQTFTHNLDGSTADYLVDLQYYSSSNGINLRYYGGMDVGAHPSAGLSVDDRLGVYWRSLDTTSITVYRRPEDIYADNVRLRIWRISVPDYNSFWVAMVQDAAQTLSHNVGGNEQNYLMTMHQYDTDEANSHNQRHLGGADFGANPPTGYNADDRVGAYWRSLTNLNLLVYRRPEDGFADYVMIRIWDYTQTLYLPLVVK
jgi:hypothetical protein